MDRIKTAVLFGGQSSEHIVSCMSAVNVIRQIDREKYDLLLIGITEDGRWLRTDCVEDIESGAWREGTVRAVILPDAQKGWGAAVGGENRRSIPCASWAVWGRRDDPGTFGDGADPLRGMRGFVIRGFYG